MRYIDDLITLFRKSLEGISSNEDKWVNSWDSLLSQILSLIESSSITGLNETFLYDLRGFLSQGLLFFQNETKNVIILNESMKMWVLSRIRFLSYLKQFCIPICLVYDPTALDISH